MSRQNPAPESPGEAVRRARVLIVGVGGLGAPAALALAAAGLGTLGLIDGDAVDISNLHRQLIYRAADLGRPKALSAAARLCARYPSLSVQAFDERLSAANLSRIFRDFDFVIDGTDEVEAKYLVNDGAVLLGVPFSHAGVTRFGGQTMTVLPRRSACLRCLFPLPPEDGGAPSCQEAGVIGPVAGTVGLLQAAEALRYVSSGEEGLGNRLLTYDGLRGGFRGVTIARDRNCPLCGDRPSLRGLEGMEGRPNGRQGGELGFR
jgi:molybdopterin/thiamine biosynthesis adenylyltransferase